MVAAEFLFALLPVVGEIEANLESTGDSLSTAERIEQRVKIGAVALADFAREFRATGAPTGPRFVVRHTRENVVVDGARLLQSRCLPGTDFVGELLDFGVDGDQLVGLLEDFEGARRVP